MLYSDGYMHDHRCDRCGCRYGDHKGGTDANGTSGICPPTRSYGHPVAMKTARIPDDKLDAYFARYWAKSQGSFLPRR